MCLAVLVDDFQCRTALAETDAETRPPVLVCEREDRTSTFFVVRCAHGCQTARQNFAAEDEGTRFVTLRVLPVRVFVAAVVHMLRLVEF